MSACTAHEHIRALLHKVGEAPYELSQMEKCDPLVKEFSLRKASGRELLETLERDFKDASSGYTEREKLLWQLQRLACITEKLHIQRKEREARIYDMERRHKEGMEAIANQIKEHEDKLSKYNEQLGHYNELFARMKSAPASVKLKIQPGPQEYAPHPVREASGNASATACGGKSLSSWRCEANWNETKSPAQPAAQSTTRSPVHDSNDSWNGPSAASGVLPQQATEIWCSTATEPPTQSTASTTPCGSHGAPCAAQESAWRTPQAPFQSWRPAYPPQLSAPRPPPPPIPAGRHPVFCGRPTTNVRGVGYPSDNPQAPSSTLQVGYAELQGAQIAPPAHDPPHGAEGSEVGSDDNPWDNLV